MPASVAKGNQMNEVIELLDFHFSESVDQYLNVIDSFLWYRLTSSISVIAIFVSISLNTV